VNPSASSSFGLRPSASLPRIIFVNRFYWPEQPATAQLLTDLAESLATAGLSITVITSHPGNASIPVTETHHGVQIIRVGGKRLGQKNLLNRAVDFTRFLLAARREIARLAHPGDTLVAMTDPPLLGVALAGIAKRKNLRLIHWIQDVFPEVAMAVGHRFTAIARPARDRAWRNAACVALGTDMASFIHERGVPEDQIHLIPNWAPEGVQPLPRDAPSTAALRTRWGLDGKLIVAYSGNLGRVHDFSAIIPLAESLRADTDIVFVFIGDGAQRPALEAAARAAGLTNIHFHPAQPRETLAATLALGDIHLVTLKRGCERLVFPSKLYGIAAVARPVFFVGPRPSEFSRLVDAHHFGLGFRPDEVPQLAQALRGFAKDRNALDKYSVAALAFSEGEGRLHHATARWLQLLTGNPLANNSGAPPL
jgi:colanic acid biosynthesis glycosyl transferase WcaI